MNAIAQTVNGFISHVAIGRTGAAIASLMQMWEQDATAETDESETDLMVALSGMVGAHALALDDE